MIERILQNKGVSFRKGGLTKLRDDLSRKEFDASNSPFKKGEVYRILHIDRHTDDGGDCAWIGPYKMSERGITDFHPDIALEGRYRGVVSPIAIIHLKLAAD